MAGEVETGIADAKSTDRRWRGTAERSIQFVANRLAQDGGSLASAVGSTGGGSLRLINHRRRARRLHRAKITYDAEYVDVDEDKVREYKESDQQASFDDSSLGTVTVFETHRFQMAKEDFYKILASKDAKPDET